MSVILSATEARQQRRIASVGTDEAKLIAKLHRKVKAYSDKKFDRFKEKFYTARHQSREQFKEWLHNTLHRKLDASTQDLNEKLIVQEFFVQMGKYL